MDVCLLCLHVVLSCVGRGLCDGLITRPEESYRVSVCVWSRNPEKGGQRSTLDYKRQWMNEYLYEWWLTFTAFTRIWNQTPTLPKKLWNKLQKRLFVPTSDSRRQNVCNWSRNYIHQFRLPSQGATPTEEKRASSEHPHPPTGSNRRTRHSRIMSRSTSRSVCGGSWPDRPTLATPLLPPPPHIMVDT
jgi:hypothetical protein